MHLLPSWILLGGEHKHDANKILHPAFYRMRKYGALYNNTCLFWRFPSPSVLHFFLPYKYIIYTYSLAPSSPFDVARTIFKPYDARGRVYTALYAICMHDAQERVAVWYIPARSCRVNAFAWSQAINHS